MRATGPSSGTISRIVPSGPPEKVPVAVTRSVSAFGQVVCISNRTVTASQPDDARAPIFQNSTSALIDPQES